MRIHLAGGKLGLPPNNMVQVLDKLLEEHGILRGVVRRVNATSILVELAETEVELPVRGASVTVSQIVEITRQDPETIALRALPDQPTVLPEIEPSRTSMQLEQALLDMNVPPTPEAILVAEGLLEGGFPLQEPLIWSLLPWAEKGQLAEAFLALKAKFPLRTEVLTMVQRFQGRDIAEPILTEAREELPSDLQALFAEPSLDNRARWSNKLAEGKLFKVLVRILVEERFVEALLNREADPGQSEHLFALPFIRKDDLYAGWLRITRENPDKQGEGAKEQSFRLELQIPTAAFGIVVAEVLVAGRNVSVILRAEGGFDEAELALQELAEELQDAGWTIRELEIRGRDDAEGRSITL
ncbi:MAG: hypothetical protein GX979_03645 [Firmicutes bacterium]|nr:hypothetical protein [Bacillota bacterium]